MPKMNTVVLDFFTSTAGNYVIDLARALSLVNRKSFRQGYVYSVDYIEFIAGDDNPISIGKIPETYCTAQAWKNAFNAWKKQRHEALEESMLVEPAKWSDFKLYFDQKHMDGTRTLMLPRGITGVTGTTGLLDTTGSEWDEATIEVNDVGAATTTRYFIGMLGADDPANNYVSALQAYGMTRGATLAPDPMVNVAIEDSWILRTGEASGDMTEDIIDDAVEFNNNPPYANEVDPANPPTYPGNSQSAPMGYLHDFGTTGTTGRPLVLDGGLFPLGLMTASFAGTGEAYYIRVHMTRGTYKGAVAAMPMGAFN